ncbi:MAG TPA: EAL domain-containing response regulator [Nevskiaceae bacterium]|nr:EAL domain-containing response regulator [Nevskiaceae bacterium]
MDVTPNATLSALVVDDSRSVRELLVAMLREMGVGTVLEASEGAEALSLCDKVLWPVDIVFCDLAMPGVDGVQTIRALAERHAHVTVVPISGLDKRLLLTVAGLAAQLGLRVDGPLSKPFDMTLIAEILLRAVRRRSDIPTRAQDVLTALQIDRALDEQRLVVHYQPKIGLRVGNVVGVEALARILDDRGGLIDPACFIEVAEQDPDRIERLTMAVAEQSIAQAGRWFASGLSLDVAINLSAEAIRRSDLPEVMGDLTNAAGLARHRITLELTETRVVNRPSVLDALSRFRLHDFGLSIDDFGTGESSLKRLKGLPFTELKVDRSFVHGADTDRDALAILQASVDLARRLSMKVVAEGVERREDWRILESLGCDQAQGFLAARPMGGSEIPGFVEAWSVDSLAKTH